LENFNKYYENVFIKKIGFILLKKNAINYENGFGIIKYGFKKL
jgi:hypothetical protein